MVGVNCFWRFAFVNGYWKKKREKKKKKKKKVNSYGKLIHAGIYGIRFAFLEIALAFIDFVGFPGIRWQSGMCFVVLNSLGNLEFDSPLWFLKSMHFNFVLTQ
jgi:hypothetical protein